MIKKCKKCGVLNTFTEKETIKKLYAKKGHIEKRRISYWSTKKILFFKRKVLKAKLYTFKSIKPLYIRIVKCKNCGFDMHIKEDFPLPGIVLKIADIEKECVRPERIYNKKYWELIKVEEERY